MATIMQLGRPNALIYAGGTQYLSNGSGLFTAADGDVFQLIELGCTLVPTLGASDVLLAPSTVYDLGGVIYRSGRDGVVRGVAAADLPRLQALAARGGGAAPPTTAGGVPSGGVTPPTPGVPAGSQLVIVRNGFKMSAPLSGLHP